MTEPTLSLTEAVTREAVLKALLDEVRAAYEEARAEVQHVIDTTGATGGKAVLPDGAEIAKASLTDPKPAAVVVDKAAFAEWVREHYETEIERQFLWVVQPASEAKWLSEMTAAGVPRVVDDQTGEVLDVPGVEIRASRSRTHSVRFAKDGRERVAEAWRAGRLGALVLPELAPAAPETPEAAA